MKTMLLLFFVLLFSPCAFAEGLSTLIEVGRGQAEIAKEAKEETKNFEKVRDAIGDGALKTGEPKDSIRKRYGAPVIEFVRDEKTKETWIYKKASSSFFDGNKIYLIFDDNGNLGEIKVVDQKKDIPQK